MYTLRDYQHEGVEKAVYHLRNDTKPFILQEATGAGKSLMIAAICRRIDEPVLILQPSKEILEQNYLKLLSYDPDIDVGIYSASKGKKEIAKFTFATIGSVRKHPEKFKHFKFSILDECHLLNPKKDDGMLTKFFKDIECKHIVGLTATPYRLDILWERDYWRGELILTSTATLKMINRISKKPFFKSIVHQTETAELIERGYLAPVRYFTEAQDWASLRLNSTGADFTTDSAEKWAWKRATRVVMAIKYADSNHKRSLTFCTSIAQAEEIKQRLLEEEGIVAELVTGSTPTKERERLIETYKTGDFKHMLNVGVFTTGFDMPILDAVILAKPTMSLALYYQMVGRGIRLDPDDPKKVLHVYDMAGVVERLGRVETIRVKKEPKGFRDEVWTEVGRMDNYPLYSFTVTPKQKEEGKDGKLKR